MGKHSLFIEEGSGLLIPRGILGAEEGGLRKREGIYGRSIRCIEAKNCCVR